MQNISAAAFTKIPDSYWMPVKWPYYAEDGSKRFIEFKMRVKQMPLRDALEIAKNCNGDDCEFIEKVGFEFTLQYENGDQIPITDREFINSVDSLAAVIVETYLEHCSKRSILKN